MPDTLRNPLQVLVAAAKLYRELALSASTLLPSRPQPARARAAAPPPRLVEVTAR